MPVFDHFITTYAPNQPLQLPHNIRKDIKLRLIFDPRTANYRLNHRSKVKESETAKRVHVLHFDRPDGRPTVTDEEIPEWVPQDEGAVATWYATIDVFDWFDPTSKTAVEKLFVNPMLYLQFLTHLRFVGSVPEDHPFSVDLSGLSRTRVVNNVEGPFDIVFPDPENRQPTFDRSVEDKECQIRPHTAILDGGREADREALKNYTTELCGIVEVILIGDWSDFPIRITQDGIQRLNFTRMTREQEALVTFDRIVLTVGIIQRLDSDGDLRVPFDVTPLYPPEANYSRPETVGVLCHNEWIKTLDSQDRGLERLQEYTKDDVHNRPRHLRLIGDWGLVQIEFPKYTITHLDLTSALGTFQITSHPSIRVSRPTDGVLTHTKIVIPRPRADVHYFERHVAATAGDSGPDWRQMYAESFAEIRQMFRNKSEAFWLYLC